MRQQMRTFDTYTHINDLKEAGFDEKQAAVIIKSLVDSRETDISHLATKEQVVALENKLTSKVDKLTSRVENIEKTMATKEQLDSSIAKLEGKIYALDASLQKQMMEMQMTIIKWVVGTMIAFSGIILAGFKYIAGI